MSTADSLPTIESLVNSPDRSKSLLHAAATAIGQSFIIKPVSTVICGFLIALPWVVDQTVFAAWLGIAGLLVLSWKTRGWRGILSTYLVGVLVMAIAFHWAPESFAYSLDSDYALGLIVSIPFLLWDGLKVSLPLWLARPTVRRFQHYWFPAGLASVAIESWLPSVFPWRLGYSQGEWPVILQAADCFGPGWSTMMLYAHAGLIIIIALIASEWLLKKRSAHQSITRFLTNPATLLCLVNFIYGTAAIVRWDMHPPTTRTYRAALVQIDPSFVDSAEKLQSASQQSTGQVDFVCWPESSCGTYDLSLTEFTDEKQVFAKSVMPSRGLRPWPTPACPLLFGGKSYEHTTGDSPDEIFVTAYLTDPDEHVIGRYHKRFLMPFGEYVPGEWIPGIDQLWDIQEKVLRGPGPETLNLASGLRIGAMLCYEDMIPEAARSLSHNGAQVLVSLINGSSFETVDTLRQHRQLAQQRAIECRRYLLRCSATGETCVVSPTGRIVEQLPLQSEGVLIATFQPSDVQTIYSRTGDCLRFATIGALAILFLRARRSSPRFDRTYRSDGTPCRSGRSNSFEPQRHRDTE